MENNQKIKNIIQALGEHKDSQAAIEILTELGTNSPDDEVRELTAQTLIRKNTHESLRVVLISKGKGINDLSARVAMASINELLSLRDKAEAIKRLKYEKPNQQICFRSQEIMDRYLKFERSEQL